VSVVDPPAEKRELEQQIARLKAELAVSRAQANSYRALLAAVNGELAVATDRYQVLTYLSDALATWNKSIDFLQSPRFRSAYQRGMDSGHAICRPPGSDLDIGIDWRVAVCCWSAWHAKHLPGDFVECGTHTGILSLAICEYVDFNATGKDFWLFDTFAGHPADQPLSTLERQQVAESTISWHDGDVFERATANFRPFPRAHLVRGRIPDTLTSVPIERVAYLSIDLNVAYPEREALAYFWPKLVPGAIVVFDDYGWLPHRDQKDSHDAFAKSQGLEIFALPTGQGLLIKV
jgi:hypothetical protein